MAYLGALLAFALLIINPLQAPSSRRITSYLFGPFSLGSNHYSVVIQKLADVRHTGTDNNGSSLRLIQIKDASNRVVRKIQIANPAQDCQVYGTAYQIDGDSGVGLGIEYANSCKNHINSGALILFHVKDGRLEPFPSKIVFHGMLEHIPIVGPQRRRLVEGDLVRYQDWVGHYYLIRAARINFSRGSLSPWCVEKCTFPIMSPTIKVSHDLSAPLSSSKDGEAHAVKIKDGSRIKLLFAYVKDPKTLGEPPSRGVAQPVQININGKRLWAHSAEALEKLGFPFQPRAKMP